MAWIYRTRGMKIKMNMEPMRKYVRIMTDASSSHKNRLFDAWADIYRLYIRRRFEARGGGTWPPLKSKTKKRVKKRSRRPLIDSETLLRVWVPGTKPPGYYETRTKKGIKLGYGGGSRHPFAPHLTISRLATIHQRGLGKVPARPIVVDPDRRTVRRMEIRLRRFALDAKKQAGMS